MMVFVTSFWLPILCATVAVFLASWVVWMVLPHHRKDWAKFKNEEAVISAIRAGMSGPGQYQFPHVDHKDMKSPEALKKFDVPPVGTVVICKGNPMKMTKSLVLHFLHTLIIAFLVALACYRILGFSTQYMSVLKMGGFFAILAYVGAAPSQSIWFGRPWGVVLKEMADGVFYALLMASVLGWLWPFKG